MQQFKRRGVANPEPIPGYAPWISNVLRNRGQDTQEKADRFMHPAWEQLHDPFLMPGMAKVVELIRAAIAGAQRILIYGDYDCDGVCATSILTETLLEMGALVDWRIPKREGEGYGLNKAAVQEVAGTYQLLITVDCGITNLEEVALAKQLGMSVIVTDHHQLGDTLPSADAILNPLREGYPFHYLCGAGVAFKLTQALQGDEAARRRLDLAALATVADLVPLVDENRVLVSLGLQAIPASTRPGMQALLTVAGCGPALTSTDLAFRLAPRINAGGRLDDAAQCVSLFLCQDITEAQERADKLNAENLERQTLQQKITQEALECIPQQVDFRNDNAIILTG